MTSSQLQPAPGGSSAVDDLARIQRWMGRLHAATQRRDAALLSAADVLGATATGDAATVALRTVTHATTSAVLPAVAPQIRAAAQAVAGAAHAAAASYSRVTGIDRALHRTTRALEAANAVVRQRGSLRAITVALDRGDLDAASRAVAEYDEVNQVLQRAGGTALKLLAELEASPTADHPPAAEAEPWLDGRSDSSASASRVGSSTSAQLAQLGGASRDPDVTVQDARRRLHEAATLELRRASDRGDIEGVERSCAMAARLGFMDEAEESYAAMRTDRNVAELKEIVARELQSAQRSSAGSHLQLVERLLDHTVLTFDTAMPFLQEHFHGRTRGLLLALHRRSTACCVEVLDDFLARRQLGVGRSSAAGHQSAASVQSRDPRVLDQQLEDLAHLVATCNTYMEFVAVKLTEDMELRQRQPRDLNASGGGTAEAKAAVRAAVQESPLSERLNDILGIFVPLQIDHFDAAARVVMEMTATRLQKYKRYFARSLAATSGGSGSDVVAAAPGATSGVDFMASVAAFMGGGTNIAGSGDIDAADADDGAAEFGFDPKTGAASPQGWRAPPIDAIDDLTFVYRGALHRAMGTRSVAVASPVLNVLNQALRETLLQAAADNAALPVVEQYSGSSGSGSAASSTLTPQVLARVLVALAWLAAISRIEGYCRHLADETEQLAQAHFGDSPDALSRFAAQRLDIVQTAQTAAETAARLAAEAGERLLALCGGPTTELTGVTFAASILARQAQQGGAPTGAAAASTTPGTEPGGWVAVSTIRFAAALAAVLQPSLDWPDQMRNGIASSFVSAVAASVEDAIRRRRVDPAGALRLDDDVRALRGFFSASAHGVPVRERFARLTAMATILVAERMSEVRAGPALTSGEVRAVLQQRTVQPTP